MFPTEKNCTFALCSCFNVTRVERRIYYLGAETTSVMLLAGINVQSLHIFLNKSLKALEPNIKVTGHTGARKEK